MTDNAVDEFLATLDPKAKDWKAVEFRCMIQDILGNEIYHKHDSDKLGDRTIFYCITIPGENEWVRTSPKGDRNEFMTNDERNHLSHLPHNASSNSSTSNSNNSATTNNNSNSNGNSEREKNDRLSFSLVNWSYPIPSDGKNRSCLIKIYDIRLVEHLRVNDIVHVMGLIEPNEFEDDSQLLTNKNSPTTNSNGTQTPASETNGNGTEVLHKTFDSDFEPANDFPHKLVPRVHVKALKKLTHINPLLPDTFTRDKIDITSVKLARARLSTILTRLLGEDSLSAEYLILSLISGIHRRKDFSTLGQLTIGLSGIKPEMKFLVDKLYDIIARITTHSHYIDMSIANLNNLSFTPKKDHENNKMIAGTLQLPDGLYLMLNETALSEGQLTVQGTENLNTLNQIIRWQKHNYNFKFHSVEIDTDLKVLVISEGKSILSVPYDVRIEKNDSDTIKIMKQACEAVDDFLTEDLLDMFRYYITALKDVPEYAIPDDVQKSIQADFVTWRQQAEAAGKILFSANDLSSYMTIARYITISRGETTLTKDIWKETCHMESTRQQRLPA